MNHMSINHINHMSNYYQINGRLLIHNTIKLIIKLCLRKKKSSTK